MYNDLPKYVVDVIKQEVDKIIKEYGIENKIIRNDIFTLLDKLCVVLRYPLEDDEEANGIHVTRCIKGVDKDFVFINTSNSIEKQVYTAAHELGHVWNIDAKVQSKVEEILDPEAIINRFAAELLMPEQIFIKKFAERCAAVGIKPGPVSEKQFVEIVLYLMNSFMVPYKAVVYRLNEVGIVDATNRGKLEKIEKKYVAFIRECAKVNDYQNVLKADKQKSMNNLYDMLNEAHEKEIISEKKLEVAKSLFDYEFIANTNTDDAKIKIKNIPGDNE